MLCAVFLPLPVFCTKPHFLSIFLCKHKHHKCTHTLSLLSLLFSSYFGGNRCVFILLERSNVFPTQLSEKQTMLTTETTTGVHQLCRIHSNEWDHAPRSFRLPGSWLDTGSGSSSKFPLWLGERPQPVPAGGWPWQGAQARKSGCGVTLGCWLMTLCCH